MMLADIVQNIFVEKFGYEPALFRSPGRINLIGEHTDYNEGFVLPAAIDKAVYLAIGAAEGEYGSWVSVDFNETIEVSNTQNSRVPNLWANYLIGVTQQFRNRGFDIPAFNLVVAADIPIGAGMSSSAALECVMAFAMNEILQSGLDRYELAWLTKKAENEFIGLQCGIMDMFASLFGREGHVLRLDCRNLAYEYFPIAMEDHILLLLDTGVKHSLASSEYNTRREECAYGVSLIKKYQPAVQHLRDVTMEMLEKHRQEFPPVVFDRCQFVLNENQRVWLTCTALQEGNLEETGRLMFASHEGLRNQYQVSCAELDFLIDRVKEHPSVFGARMMGGGFGGCTINLVKRDAVDQVVDHVYDAYREFSGISLKNYEVVTGEGTSQEAGEKSARQAREIQRGRS